MEHNWWAGETLVLVLLAGQAARDVDAAVGGGGAEEGSRAGLLNVDCSVRQCKG